MIRPLTHRYAGPATESVLLLTGGWIDGSTLSSVEVYPPSSSSCSPPPPLPLPRSGHTTFWTSEPNPVIATCGGKVGPYGHGTSSSCLVLDKSRRWDASRMGNLTMPRYMSASASLNSVGTFIVGGFDSEILGGDTTDFLAAGSMQWQQGPPLPALMNSPCAVTITDTSFLVIEDDSIHEFDSAIAGPTSREGWREAGRWPRLKTRRRNQAGCAKLGRKVIIAGGYKTASTEVLDLDTRQITSGGDMSTPRYHFHLATIGRAGLEKVFAIAGMDGSYEQLNTVEEWDEENSTWKPSDDNLPKKKAELGAVAVPEQLICPS